MVIKTGRFGDLEIQAHEKIVLPEGLVGLPSEREFILVDPGDETLILWLQSVTRPEFCIPVLEPKIFRPDYTVRLSAAELRNLKLDHVNQSAVFCVLTIPSDISEMTANLKAPIVINLREQIAKQVVLQENEYGIKTEIFKELRAHLMTLRSQRRAGATSSDGSSSQLGVPVSVKDIPPSLTVRTLA